MKKTGLKKLSLDRETLVSLTPDALAGVAGGVAQTNSVPNLSQIACPTKIICPTTRGCPSMAPYCINNGGGRQE